LLDVEGWPVRCLADVLPPHADDIGTPLRAVEQPLHTMRDSL
jgi:hypothetical protein